MSIGTRAKAALCSLAALAALALGACGHGGGDAAGATSPKAEPTPRDDHGDRLAGDWSTSIDAKGLVGHNDVPLKLEITGSHVLGKIGADGLQVDGQLKDDDTVVGSWKETDGEGDFTWKFSPDARSFKGTFGGMLHSKPVPEGSSWSGVRK